MVHAEEKTITVTMPHVNVVADPYHPTILVLNFFIGLAINLSETDLIASCFGES